MKHMELECKILDINKDEFIKKIESLGAELKEEANQYLYTYDLFTIYGRYIDIKTQLRDNENKMKYETAIEKLKLLFFELDNLLTDNNRNHLKEIIGTDDLLSLCDKPNILDYIDTKEFIFFMNKFHNNSKKWIRVRQTNNITTIAVKHILAPDETNIQQMLETEIEVPSIKDANNLLEALGFSHKSYQEKQRITYILDNHEIDIDTWPGIPTYIEIEGESEKDLDEFLSKLGYSIKDTVSCTADDIYEKYGINSLEMREIKFSDFN